MREEYVQAVGNMYTLRAGAILLWSMSCMAAAFGQSHSDPISIRAIAEVEAAGKLVPADRVVSGDRVRYSLEVRNTGASTVPPPTVTYAVPAHTVYAADSAVGPGTEVSYSVDGGRSFDRPENLRVPAPEAQTRLAVAADYTHIRWRLKNRLKANSVAFVRFRAVVK
jgi:uncharacterized repeat protein (TIGR01451 family)